MTAVTIAIQVYAITGSTFAVGLVGLFALVPLVAFGLYGGAFADAVDRRKLALVVVARAVGAVARAGRAGGARAGLGVGAVRRRRAAVGFFAVNNPTRSAIIPRLIDRGAAAGGERPQHGVVQPRLHRRAAARRAGDRRWRLRVRLRDRRGDVHRPRSTRCSGCRRSRRSRSRARRRPGPGLRSVIEGLRFLRGAPQRADDVHRRPVRDGAGAAAGAVPGRRGQLLRRGCADGRPAAGGAGDRLADRVRVLRLGEQGPAAGTWRS